MSQDYLSAKERGGFLEDSVADYLRHLGFEVVLRTRLSDKYEVQHEIDVLASRTEAFGTIRLAVECKYVKTPIDIKEVRNFHDKLTSLGITKGIFVSTGGFTADAEAHAKALGIELWDLRTLQEKLDQIRIPEKETISDALPVMALDPYPRHLTNWNLLSAAHKLYYFPLYFANYRCFSQHTVTGQSVILESEGYVIVDGITGTILDSRLIRGLAPNIPTTGIYADCLAIAPQVLQRTPPQNLQGAEVTVEPQKVDATRARESVKEELVKNLSIATKRTRYREISPRKKDIEITSLRLVKVPHLYSTFKFKDKSYQRVFQAATNKMIRDETTSCAFLCPNATALCEECGQLVCGRHLKICVTCGMKLCDRCITSKGFITKKYYCPRHTGQ